jgi:hypothetical protein
MSYQTGLVPSNYLTILDNLSSVSEPVFLWDNLILTPSNQPSPLFRRLIDAIFTYFLSNSTSKGLSPAQYEHAFATLMYPEDENKAHYIFSLADEYYFPSAEGFVNKAMGLFYQSFRIPNTTQNGRPVLTREGFHAVMLRDTLVDPDAQSLRFNTFLGIHGERVLESATGLPFPTLVIPRSAFPPHSDEVVRQTTKTCNETFNSLLKTSQILGLLS